MTLIPGEVTEGAKPRKHELRLTPERKAPWQMHTHIHVSTKSEPSQVFPRRLFSCACGMDTTSSSCTTEIGEASDQP